MIGKSTRNQDELSRILDACLGLIADGSGTVDTVIEQYPEYSEELRPALEAAEWLQARSEVFNPRPGFIQLSQRRLVNRFRSNMSRPAADHTETMSRIPAFFQDRRMVVQYSALLTLTAVLLFIGYRSTIFLIQRSIPGDPLYATKLAQEEMTVSLTSNESKKARLRIEFAQRRVIEMQELILVGRDSFVNQTFENFKFQMAEAASGIMSVAKLDQSDAAILSSLFEETLRVPVKNLAGLLDTTKVLASVEFVETVETLTAGIFELPPFETILVLATSSPTNALLTDFIPTSTTTPTFTATVYLQIETAEPEQESTTIPSTNTPTATKSPTAKAAPANTPIPSQTPVPTATKSNTPTSAPTITVSPEPTSTPEPTQDKTKKPKPTNHPTYWPTSTP